MPRWKVEVALLTPEELEKPVKDIRWQDRPMAPAETDAASPLIITVEAGGQITAFRVTQVDDA